ncbi:MAG: molybdopterin converting factor small subunit [Myxococcota bacterium]
MQQLLDHVLSVLPSLRSEMLDEQGQLSKHVHIFVNGRGSIFLDDALETKIDMASDRIDFFPAVAGG